MQLRYDPPEHDYDQEYQHIQDTAEYIDEMNDRIFSGAFAGSQQAGRLPHNIAQFQMAFTDVASYWRSLADVVEPYGDEDYGALDRIRQRLGLRTRSETILHQLPSQQLEQAYEDAREAYEQDIETALETLVIGTEEKPGEEISDEEQEQMAPLETVFDLVTLTEDLQDQYDPRR